MITISFSNLKGGVGKSSLTLETANWFSKQGKNVIIVDCDLAQKTLVNAKRISEKQPYDVLTFDPSATKEKWEQLFKSIEAYDYAFFDIPGSVFQPGILTMLNMMNKIIVVTRHSPKDLSSTAEFISLLKEQNITEFKILFNMLRPYRDQEHREIIDEIKENREGLTAQVLGVNSSFFFKNSVWDEQAAIEKNMELGSTHKNIELRYSALFSELETFINPNKNEK